MINAEQGNAVAARPFADVIREMDGGRVYTEAGQTLGEVVEAVIKHRKPGKFVLTLSIAPNGEGSVEITDSVDVKMPKAPRRKSIFFVKDGALMREDPRQTKMELRTVETVAQAAARTLPPEERQPLRTVEN